MYGIDKKMVENNNKDTENDQNDQILESDFASDVFYLSISVAKLIEFAKKNDISEYFDRKQADLVSDSELLGSLLIAGITKIGNKLIQNYKIDQLRYRIHSEFDAKYAEILKTIKKDQLISENAKIKFKFRKFVVEKPQLAAELLK